MKYMVHTNNKKYGFTVMELLLVVAVLAVLAALIVPYYSEASLSVNDGTAEQMTTNLIATARSMAIAGRVNESTITFKSDGTITVGDNTYKLPSNFSIDISSDILSISFAEVIFLLYINCFFLIELKV